MNDIFDKLLIDVEKISTRADNWNKKGFLSPKESLDASLLFIKKIINMIVVNNYKWKEPFISSDEDGNITFKWSNSNKDLHIICGKEYIGYFKIWGDDIFNEMEDGNIDSEEKIHDTWKWLLQ